MLPENLFRAVAQLQKIVVFKLWKCMVYFMCYKANPSTYWAQKRVEMDSYRNKKNRKIIGIVVEQANLLIQVKYCH